jgi:hypothetical protein
VLPTEAGDETTRRRIELTTQFALLSIVLALNQSTTSSNNFLSSPPLRHYTHPPCTMARFPTVPLMIHVAAASAAGRPHIDATTSASPSPPPPSPPPAPASHRPHSPAQPPTSPRRPFPHALVSGAAAASPTTPIHSTSSLRDPPPNTTPPGPRSPSPSTAKSSDDREDRRKGKGRERDEL